MMKIKFNHLERVAGIFVMTAIGGFLVSLLGMAIKQGWFESRVYFTSYFDSADGIHPGVVVQMSGLKAGSVESVVLTSDNKVKVQFAVFRRFHEKIKKDSEVQLVRPFIIGERVLDLSVGSSESPMVAEESEIPAKESLDLMTLMSGKRLGSSLTAMVEIMKNFKVLLEAVLDKNRTQAFIGMIDRMDPLIKNMNTMSVEVTKLAKQASGDDQTRVALSELATAVKAINKVLPELTQQAPQLGADVRGLVSNLAELTKEFKAFIPAVNAIAPDLPKTSKRAVEALDEAVVLMKALQKSFLLRSNVREVREDETTKAPREPATTPSSDGDKKDKPSN